MCTHNISLLHDIRDTPNYLSFNITTGAFEHIYMYNVHLVQFFFSRIISRVTGYDRHATIMNMQSYSSRFARFGSIGVEVQLNINKFMSNTNILRIVFIFLNRGRWSQRKVWIIRGFEKHSCPRNVLKEFFFTSC